MTTTTWIFGYGSLIWRPDFPWTRRVPGEVRGLARRFWQGSPDHRGTPEAPGRVVTLVDAEGEAVFGVAFEVEAAARGSVLERLDHREQGGYVRREVTVHPRDGAAALDALVYVAAEDNPCWLGPASLDVIARTVAAAEGPSGTNREYVLRLAEAVRHEGGTCAHLFDLEAALLRLPVRR